MLSWSPTGRERKKRKAGRMNLISGMYVMLGSEISNPRAVFISPM